MLIENKVHVDAVLFHVKALSSNFFASLADRHLVNGFCHP